MQKNIQRHCNRELKKTKYAESIDPGKYGVKVDFTISSEGKIINIVGFSCRIQPTNATSPLNNN